MAIEVRPFEMRELETLRSLVRHPSLAGEFDWVQPDGRLEDLLEHPFDRPSAVWLGLVDGAPAAFCRAAVLPSRAGYWCGCFLGVASPFRRLGLGSRLLDTVLRWTRDLPPDLDVHELTVSAWMPNEVARAFAEGKGFVAGRWFWLMERPVGSRPALDWPDRIEVRTFDGSEAQIHEVTACYNEAFAEHYHAGAATDADLRLLIRQSHFHADGFLLAYRGTRCVGFCRNALFGTRFEVDVLGVTPDARGIGLGRALLRWGVRWLEDRGAPVVTLMVEGQNERAQGLYRAEAFRVVRTRQVWTTTLSALRTRTADGTTPQRADPLAAPDRSAS